MSTNILMGVPHIQDDGAVIDPDKDRFVDAARLVAAKDMVSAINGR
jgi:hypothetical protein